MNSCQKMQINKINKLNLKNKIRMISYYKINNSLMNFNKPQKIKVSKMIKKNYPIIHNT